MSKLVSRHKWQSMFFLPKRSKQGENWFLVGKLLSMHYYFCAQASAMCRFDCPFKIAQNSNHRLSEHVKKRDWLNNVRIASGLFGKFTLPGEFLLNVSPFHDIEIFLPRQLPLCNSLVASSGRRFCTC